MKREWIRNLVALFLFVGLLLYVSWNRKSTFEEGEREEKAKKIAVVEPDRIVRVEFENGSGHVVFERRPKDEKGRFTDAYAPLSDELEQLGDWAVVEPYRALSDFYGVKTLLDHVRDLSLTKVVDEKGTTPGTYGLKPAQARIALFEKEGRSPAVDVRVGEANSAQSGLYVRIGSDPRILLTSMSLEYLKTRTPNDWRERMIAGFGDLSKVTAVDAEYLEPKKRRILKLTKGPNGWEMASPRKLPVDENSVERYLNDFKSLRALEFVSEAADRDAGKFGLDRPYARIHVRFDAPSGPQERTIFIGSKREKERPVYVRRADFPWVAKVAPIAPETLAGDVRSLAVRKPLGLPEMAVTKVVVGEGAKVTELQMKDGAWALVKPAADRADPTEARTLVGKLAGLTANEVLPDGSVVGKSLPMSLAVSTQAATRELRLSRDEAANTAIGVWVGEGIAYRFAPADLRAIVEQAGRVRERRLVPFDLGELAKFSILRGPFAATFERQPDEEWKATSIAGAEPAAMARLASREAIGGIVNELRNLRIDAFDAGAAPTESAELLKLELTWKKGTPLTWWIEPAKGDKRKTWSKERNVTAWLTVASTDALEAALGTVKEAK
jgi:hypothetical protein